MNTDNIQYAKADENTLKVVQQHESTISIDDLIIRQTELKNALDEIESLISQAKSLGIKTAHEIAESLIAAGKENAERTD